jgi:hypothetical protein
MDDRPEVLREYRVKIIPVSESKPLGERDLGQRTKFGGLPDEVQPGGPEKLTCPGCHKKMHFVAQIDSFEFTDESNPNRKEFGDTQFMFGDVGMIYVWFCFECLTPYSTMECY